MSYWIECKKCGISGRAGSQSRGVMAKTVEKHSNFDSAIPVVFDDSPIFDRGSDSSSYDGDGGGLAMVVQEGIGDE